MTISLLHPVPVLADEAGDLDAQGKLLDLQAKQVTLEKSKIDRDQAQFDLQKSALTVTPGKTDLQSGAGTAEEMYLSDGEMVQLAIQVANAARAACDRGGPGTPIVLYGAARPSKAESLNFDAAIQKLKAAYNNAGNAMSTAAGEDEKARKEAEAKKKKPTKTMALMIPAVVGTVALILNAFKTDYTLGGATLTTDPQQFTIEVRSRIAGADQDATPPVPRHVVFASELANWPQTAAKITSLQGSDLAGLAGAFAKAQGNAVLAAKRADELKTDQPRIAALYLQALGQLNAYIADSTAFQTALAAVDANGNSLLTRIAAERALEEMSACRVSASILHAAGSYYTKSDITTFFGSMPFHASAYVAASMTVWNKDLELQYSANFLGWGPFYSFRDIHPPAPVSAKPSGKKDGGAANK